MTDVLTKVYISKSDRKYFLHALGWHYERPDIDNLKDIVRRKRFSRKSARTVLEFLRENRSTFLKKSQPYLSDSTLPNHYELHTKPQLEKMDHYIDWLTELAAK